MPGRRELREATGGEDRQCCVLGVRLFGLLLPILAPPEVYSEGLTGRVSSHRTDQSHSSPACGRGRDRRMVMCVIPASSHSSPTTA